MDCIVNTGQNAQKHKLLDENAEPTDLPLSLLEDITKCFSDDLQIGSGGFAVVYKGVVGDGMVAVKKLSRTYQVPEHKFHTEIECLIKAKHKNIVRFIGYCADTQGKVVDHEGKMVMADVRNWLLCFEYVPNGSLDKYITDASHGLEWRERYRIINGICEGLLHLHRQRILHSDLKPANILVDSHMVPKITDFGLSRCLDKYQTRAFTSHPCGTQGYLAPECYRGEFSFASDIYSLGVIIMELLTGKKGFTGDNHITESWMNQLKASDQCLQRDMQLEQVRVCTKIGTECMDVDPKKRPTARHIVDRLDKLASADYSDGTAISNSLTKLQIREMVAKVTEKNKVVTKVPRKKEVVDQNQCKLRFINSLDEEMFTNMGIYAADGDPLMIYLDLNKNCKRNSNRSISEAMIKIVVLDGDFNINNKNGWTSEDFTRHIVCPRDNVGAVLTGDLELRLRNCKAYLRNATFIDISGFTRSGKFRLGAIFVDDFGVRVQEGITEPFIVKDGRGKAYQKHVIPSLDDDLWRLHKITKGGTFCTALIESNIFCVKDLLRMYYKDEHALRNVLKKASEPAWKTIIDHAKTCDPGNGLYSFDVEGHNVVLFFDSFYRIVGATFGDQYTPFSALDKPMQDRVREWSDVAYETLANRRPDYEMDN